MKLLRVGERDCERPALLGADGSVRDLSSEIEDIGGAFLEPRSLERLRALDPGALPAVAPGTRIGPCIARPATFVAVGLNYRDAEKAAGGFGVPAEPVLYLKAPNCIAGPDDSLSLPIGAERVDWEVELGVVIGRETNRVHERDALEHVAGYCIVNDVTERGWQHERGGQWTKGKSADGFGPVGPWLVTPDELPDLAGAAITLELDDTTMQSATLSDMIHGVAALVAYVSRFMRLRPGDLVATGTPPGVGFVRQPPRFLQPGERMTLCIEGLGRQSILVEPASQ